MLPLFGLLAATAFAGQNWAIPYIKERMRKKQGEVMGGILDQADAMGGGNDNTARAMAEGGLLDGPEFMQHGFLGQLMQMQNDLGMERDAANNSADDTRLRAQAEREQNQNFLRQQQEIASEFQPVIEDLNHQYSMNDRVMAIAKDFQSVPIGERSTWFGTPEGRAVRAQLQEAEEFGFSAFKKSVYGEAEPPPAELDRLRGAYKQFSGGSLYDLMLGGHFDTVDEVYGRRQEELIRRKEEIQGDYFRRIDQLEQGGGLAIPGGMGGNVTASSKGGGDLINNESGGNWSATNSEGMLGRGQFSPERLDAARSALNMKFTDEEFLADPKIQMKVEDWHFDDIENYIGKNGLDDYIGGELNGVPITLQGLINVAHLGGNEGMKKFLESGGQYNPSDSNGTSLLDYLKLGARG